MKFFTIIVPVYFNKNNLLETIPRLMNLSENLEDFNTELIFVDDGSGDGSLDLLVDFQSRYPKIIKIIKLTRNFGSMAAIQAGFLEATGDCVGMISADLQDPPELFIDMIKKWKEGSKAVFAVRQDREDPVNQKLFSSLFYFFVRKYAIPEYPKNGFDFFLVDRQIVDLVNKIQEKNTNLMTLIYWLGFDAVLIPYTRKKRIDGKSRWTLKKKVKLFVDTFISFSFFPIRALSFIGLLFAIGAIAYGIFVFFYWVFRGIEVKGWVTSILIMAFTSGLQMAMLGVLGEYLWRILDEVRKRPSFVVDDIYKNGKHITGTDDREM